MSDILFKCWKCFQSIAIPDQAVGRTILCPDCFKQLTVPAPSITYKCSSCGYDLCSPEAYAGDKAKCPSCQHEFTIPEELSAPRKLVDSSTDVKTVSPPGETLRADASAIVSETNAEVSTLQEGGMKTDKEDNEAKRTNNETGDKNQHATVLIPCPACGKQISQRITVCPACGEPVKLFPG
jgi:DNA-directed RNA polymerase subunit RPC12/RpoP